MIYLLFEEGIFWYLSCWLFVVMGFVLFELFVVNWINLNFLFWLDKVMRCFLLCEKIVLWCWMIVLFCLVKLSVCLFIIGIMNIWLFVVVIILLFVGFGCIEVMYFEGFFIYVFCRCFKLEVRWILILL